MINFTAGPVQENGETLKIGAQRTPYFRNDSFSTLMLENESMIKALASAPQDSRAIFLTASGTGAMEAAVMNSFSQNDKVLIVDGGGFGHRFVELCQLHHISYTTVPVPYDKNLTQEMLSVYDHKGYTGFLINMHETSIGKLYDMRMVSRFCKRNNLFLVVDTISSFLADEFDMECLGVDVMLTASQKALAVPPGISILVLSSRAIERVKNAEVQSMYFNLASALKNGERGQTPFTPAVSILLQLHSRLKSLVKVGADAERKRIAKLTMQFREGVSDLSIQIPNINLSNAITPCFMRGGAYTIFKKLEQEYGIWVCPSGGELRDRLLRVGHMGDLTERDNEKLLEALHNLKDII